MSVSFKGDVADIILDHAEQVQVIFHELRKDVPQQKYLFCIPEDVEIFNPVTEDFEPLSDEYKGYWMMESAAEIDTYMGYNFDYAIRNFEWIKVKEIQVTTTEWIPIEE
jgi:hypothetical protein